MLKSRFVLTALLLMTISTLCHGQAADGSGNKSYGRAVANVIESDDAVRLDKQLSLGLDPNGFVLAFNEAKTLPMLEYACRLAKPKVIASLVRNGANLASTATGRLPIEIVLDQGRKDLAVLLAKPEVKLADDVLLNSIAARVLRDVPKLAELDSASEYSSIHINGKPLSESMVMAISNRRFSTANGNRDASHPQVKWDLKVFFPDAFDRTTIQYELTMGGSLAGGESRGKFTKSYGYWLLSERVSADR